MYLYRLIVTGVPERGARERLAAPVSDAVRGHFLSIQSRSGGAT